MAEDLSIALAQLNPTVGDIVGNVAKLMAAWRQAQSRGVKLLITPELYLVGAEPDDFILKPRLQKVIRDSVEAVARDTVSGPSILLGTPWLEDGNLYNAALLLDGGNIISCTYEHDLPNYGPFDKKRLFAQGPIGKAVSWQDTRLGIMLCEDMWTPETAIELKKQGADLLIVMNASPYQVGKQHRRYDFARERIRETGLSLVYVNQIGGQDELLYEGGSFVMTPNGEVKVQARAWYEDVVYVDFKRQEQKLVPEDSPLAHIPEGDASIYQAIMLGIRDYVRKNGFSSVLVGLSGGLDSALCAALAVDALGAANVRSVMMPSPFTSPQSLEDATEVAKNLGCRLDVIRIDEAMSVFDKLLAEQFIGCAPDITEENIQARIRTLLLMALSNKSGAMVLAASNKSELSVGYTTLYGDACGGYAPLKDVYKTGLYRLALWRNENKPDMALGPERAVIPPSIIGKPPSAELRADQRDEEDLMPYETLDGILNYLIEDDLGVAETTMMGYDPVDIRKVYTMLDRAEYKRRQGPPGPKISRRHITKDRRYPMTNRYSDKWNKQPSD
ncbi:MAG: NAD+ synthase [Alphaproteobacteria bacterium]|nr:NAD+ synthase [Alphaproteobacteria bacterium]